ncbi:MAG: hypothetical protein ACOC22_01955, partial [bacterium]
QSINSLINDMSGTDKRKKAYRDMKKDLDSLLRTQEQLIDNEKETNKHLIEQNKNLQKQNASRRIGRDITREITNQLKIGWQYLMESDKVIKSTILNLGMSGAKAELMRTSFEESAGLAARLGGNIQDVQHIMEGFADETGRARALMSESVEAIIQIGRGTGLGVENATKLAAQFEFMGKDAIETMNYVQGVVDTSERMGVNTTRVLRNISDNFKKLSTFTFQKGTKAFAEMAQNAERLRVDMATALNVAEATRGLETVIELGANLQVMGGEFAKMDPLHRMYTVRNEPERITDMLSEMTKGIYTLRQQADGTFERFISPADRDRLANVAKSLGITNEEMFEIAQRRHDIDMMAESLSGMGLDPELKKMVEGMAEFDSDTGRHFIMLGGYRKDISELTKEQVKAFKSEQKTLRERAKEAQTFNEVFQVTLNELKTTLLPLLRGVNKVIESARPVIIGITEFITSSDHMIPAWAKAGATLLTAGLIWKGVTRSLGMLGDWTSDKLFGGGGKGKTGGANARTNRPKKIRGGGMKGLGSGVGAGAAGLGIGGGISIAAEGFSELADAIQRVDKDKLGQLNVTFAILGGTIIGTLIPSIFLLGKTGAVAAPGLLALGAAALMIGGAIGVAAWGVGQMAEGIGSLVEKSKGAGWELAQVGAGIAAINTAMAATGTLGWLGGKLGGLSNLSNTLEVISDHSDGISKVGEAFKHIGVVMSGSREDFEAVERAVKSISQAKMIEGNMFADLANLLNKPLKVEFADAQANFVSNITLEIDGERFVNKVVKAKTVATKFREAKEGRE